MAPSWLTVGFLGLIRVTAALGPQLSPAQMWREFHLQPELEPAAEGAAGPKLVRLFANDSAPGAPDPSTLYRPFNFSVPIDHFHNDSMYEPHSNGSFPLRYWYDDRFYKPGGPVIALTAGETSGAGRLPFLQKGIVAILAEATNGVGVILEHRYYGRSYPTPDFSTENLRFLTTDQALADTAYFAKNIVFPGKLAGVNLTAPETPWIVYGGSYAGAFVAFLRKLYPEVFWGAISSSGVTAAVVDFWEYYEAARRFAPEGCAETTQKLMHMVDNILMQKGNTTEEDIVTLKTAFGLPNVTASVDFASAIGGGIAGLQGRNWDPALDSDDFLLYCGNMTSDDLVWPATDSLDSSARYLLEIGGYESEVTELAPRLKNYIGYVNYTSSWCDSENQDECFGPGSDDAYAADDLSASWRLWAYQYCSQWGYLQTGSGVPEDQLPLISRLIDIEYSTVICRKAFNITSLPDVEAINKYGGYNFSYPRVAIIDGESDPWRSATPNKIGLPRPESTTEEPNLVITGGAVHHWDENGIFKNETTADLPPLPVKEAQSFEVEFVQAWLKEFAATRK
ncbi:serine carboxypeptidase S28 [Colletotrichum scovillei]|uniref:Serine carboxypeptidase S28 n=1 Tax=Colletotrichum scovillei TaxID=1209932 RepID=A0A9P7R074_9PEZI|nr:serine carboxypeptidase S28 [Colletotrichum scovillei]KAF4784080.1 serine carboxypeptidase S28 [Colletotrichum scovillei]KAG7044331.1 serine carboxypeptidase S28 [Colletotrichum scovillei]KAG7049039.1 serine carboxypeptidase S28 [Colletotrichum scovillei]KAG7063784.1 serine carboxypeptidase S28 [Colletotrichum scovillei]